MTDLKTLREVAERAQVNSTEEAMNEFCAAFNLPTCLALLDRIEELRGALEPFADASRHLGPGIPDDATSLDGIKAAHWRRAGRAFFDSTGRQARDQSEIDAALKDTPNG